MDSGVYTHYSIPPFYDPMISKRISWGKDRNEAIKRMRRAPYEYDIVGVKINIPFHMAVMENPRYVEEKPLPPTLFGKKENSRDRCHSRSNPDAAKITA